MRSNARIVVIAALLAASGCGSSETCATSDECGAGNRCVKSGDAFEGSCEACPAEVRYDGVDNDCNAATKDGDLDGDGDNARTAAVGPGLDCDDADPSISSRQTEVCGDGKDNDCDDRVDGPPCGDVTDPTVRFMRPADGMAVRGTIDVEISATDESGIASIELTAGNRPAERLTLSPYVFRIDTNAFGDGPVTLTAVATDRAGRTATATIRINVSNRGQPSVSFVSPVEGARYGGAMTVELSVVDPSAMTRVELRLDGAPVATFTGPPYRATIDTRAHAEAAHTIEVVATDAFGTQVSESRRVVFDNTGPSLSFAPGDGAMVAGLVDFRITASDPAGIASITSDGTTTATDALSITLDLEAQPSGPVQVSATAVDGAIVDGMGGNATTRTITVINTNRGPGLGFDSPLSTGSYGGNTTIAARAVDPRGVTQVIIRLDGVAIATLAAPPYRTVVDTRALADGVHQLELEATDTLGNTSTATSSFTVDNTGPVITFVRPLAGASVSGAIPVEVTATDASGVAMLSSNTASTSGDRLVYTLDTLTLNNGNYTIPAEARDSAIVDDTSGNGNVTTNGRTIIVFNTGNIPPAIQITNPRPNDGVLVDVDIQVNATSAAGVARVEFAIDGTPVGSDTSAPYSFTAPLGDRTGLLTITATAVGRNGVRASASVQVEVVAGPDVQTVRPILPGIPAPDDFAWVDVTGDGLRDVVAVDTVSTLSRGQPGGSFAQATPIGLNASFMQVVDYDGDGDLDILATTTNVLRGLTNDGTGTFTADFMLPLGAAILPVELVAGDLDADGDVDVLVANRGSGFDFLVVHRNNGIYGVIATRGGVGNVTDLELGDVDGDTTPDVAITRGGTGNFNVSVFRNADGLGTFSGAGLDTLMPGNQNRVRITEVNADGYPDLVLSVPTPSDPQRIDPGFVVLIGDRTRPGRYAQTLNPTLPEESGEDVVVGDLDNDGDNDLLTVMDAFNGARLFINDGTGNFSYGRRYVLGVYPTRPKLIDVDLDGLLDVVSIGNIGTGLTYARNLGNGRLDAAPTRPLREGANAFDDGALGGSTLPDFAVAFRQEQIRGVTYPPMTQMFVNVGDDQLTLTDQHIITQGITAPTSVAIGDLDGQLERDVAVGSAVTANTARMPCPMNGCGANEVCNANNFCSTVNALVYVSTGNGQYGLRPLSGLDRPQVAEMGDIMPGGFDELVFAVDPPMGPDGVVVFGNATTPLATLLTQQGAGALHIADIAEPFGLLDLLVANRVSNTITLHRQRPGGLDPAETFNVFAQLNALASGFLAPDALLDLFGLTSSGVVALLGEPLFTLGSPTNYPAGVASLDALGAVDLNGDGLDDAVTLTPATSRLRVMIARPQGGFFPAVAVPVSDTSLDVRVGDYNGDGLRDVAVLSAGHEPGITFIYAR